MGLHTEYIYPDSRTAYIEHYWRMLDPDRPVPYYRGVVGYEDDVVIVVNKPDPTKLNLGWVDFTPARWNRFSNQYIDRGQFTWFLERLTRLKPSQTAGYTCPVRAEHNLGNCLLAITGRKRGKGKAEITLHSRTTIWAPTGILDLYLGSLVATYWQSRISEPVSLRWVLDQCQATTWKSLPFLINMAYMERDATNAEHINHTRWIAPLVLPSMGSNNVHGTQNRYTQAMRNTYYQARNIHEFIDRTYRLPARQTNRMLAAERRYQAGAQRQLFPSIGTLLDPGAMESYARTLPVDEEVDEEDLQSIED